MAPLRLRRINLSGYLTLVSIVCIGALLLWYAAFQARSLILGPQITIEKPISVVSDARTIEISGVAANITSISLNGRSIYTDESGYFTEQLVLPEGYAIMTFEAHDRYGRTQTVRKTLVYNPTTGLSMSPFTTHATQ